MANPFHTHLTFFSTTSTVSAATTGRPSITLLSGLKQSLRLGLNFPLAVLTSLALRFLYGNPFNLYLRPIDVRAVRTRRTMLEDVPIRSGVDGVTKHDVLSAIQTAGKGVGDRLHVRGLWGVCANAKGIMGPKELESCKKGELMWLVAGRRRMRDGLHGDVLPFSRGGPISAAGHAFFVKKLLDVQIYQSEKKHGD